MEKSRMHHFFFQEETGMNLYKFFSVLSLNCHALVRKLK